MSGGQRLWGAGPVLAIVVVVVAGCGVSGQASSPKTTAAPATTSITTTSLPTTTLPGNQTSGTRTVLSPIGVNLRDQPAATGQVLGTAAQGAVLTVVGFDPTGGGWYHVRGATVTGWISAGAGLSATGDFKGYSSAKLNFDALYPSTWTVQESATSTDFVAPAGGGSITVVTGANVAALPKGQSGYALSHTEQIVVCGVTSYLDGYTTAAPGSAYLAQISLPVDATHALGIEGSLPGASQLSVVRAFAASVTFSSPACQG